MGLIYGPGLWIQQYGYAIVCSFNYFLNEESISFHLRSFHITFNIKNKDRRFLCQNLASENTGFGTNPVFPFVAIITSVIPFFTENHRTIASELDIVIAAEPCQCN